MLKLGLRVTRPVPNLQAVSAWADLVFSTLYSLALGVWPLPPSNSLPPGLAHLVLAPSLPLFSLPDVVGFGIQNLFLAQISLQFLSGLY